MYNQRHPRRPFKKVHFVPQAPLAQHFAVIRCKDNHGIFIQAGRFQRLQNLADFLINITNGAVIGVPGIAHSGFGQVIFVHGAHVIQALAVGIKLVIRQGRHRGHVDIVMLIQIPITRGNGKGVVRMRKGDRYEKRTLVRTAGHIKNFTNRPKGDFFIEIKLIAGDTLAGLNHAEHIVIPRKTIFRRLIPVRCPAKIRRINIGGETLFKAVELVWPNEMHLANQAGLIPHSSQIMRYCRDF